MWYPQRFGLNSSLVTFVVTLLLLLGIVSRVECVRDFKSLFESQLPKGPVPPSGPSLCHNKLGPFKDNKVSFPDDYYIGCP